MVDGMFLVFVYNTWCGGCPNVVLLSAPNPPPPSPHPVML